MSYRLSVFMTLIQISITTLYYKIKIKFKIKDYYSDPEAQFLYFETPGLSLS